MRARHCLVLAVILVVLLSGMVVFAGGQSGAATAEKYRIVGCVTFPKQHFFGQTADKFAELVHKYYSGDVDVQVHYSAELGSETDVFGYMVQGTSVDFGIITPNSVTRWAPVVSILSAPFVFRDLEHWKKAIKSDALDKIKKAVEDSGVLVFGWEGGSYRNLILRNPINESSDLSKIRLRVQQAPLQEKIFTAIGFKTVPIVYQEVYDAIRTGAADGLENEPAGYRDMKFYEVAPNFVLSKHTIATWGFMFSKKTFDKLPADLQKAIARAGAEAVDYHTMLETSQYESVVQQLAKDYGVNVVQFNNAKMREKALPVLTEFAREVNATDVLEAINRIK